jgi:hypothetical protein
MLFVGVISTELKPQAVYPCGKANSIARRILIRPRSLRNQNPLLNPMAFQFVRSAKKSTAGQGWQVRISAKYGPFLRKLGWHQACYELDAGCC